MKVSKLRPCPKIRFPKKSARWEVVDLLPEGNFVSLESLPDEAIDRIHRILSSQPEEVNRQPEAISIPQNQLNQLDPKSNQAKFFDALTRRDKPECLRLLIQEYLSLPKCRQRCRISSQ